MVSQLHMAKSATFALQRKMQMIADNVANAQTVGYKASRMQMENLFPLVLAKSLSENEEVIGTPGQPRRKYFEYGQGVKIAEVTRNMEQGNITVTNRPMDVAIQGRGWMQFRIPDGRVAYSRAGNLHIDNQGNVVDANGNPLEPPVRLPQDTTEVIINQEGAVFVQTGTSTTPQQVGQMLLGSFVNDEGLLGIGQNLYVETSASGTPTIVNPGREAAGSIRQRALEFSNVNIVEELMQMLLLQRNFDVAMKAIKASDQILKDGADLK